jgi:hypothetical protein
MKIRHKTDSMDIEIEGKDIKDAFAQLAAATEVFGNNVCGACDSPRTRPIVRERDGNTYYEVKCLDCGSVLAFGQKREGGALFPKKKDKDGNWLTNNGWVKWQRSEQTEDFGGRPFA